MKPPILQATVSICAIIVISIISVTAFLGVQEAEYNMLNNSLPKLLAGSKIVDAVNVIARRYFIASYQIDETMVAEMRDTQRLIAEAFDTAGKEVEAYQKLIDQYGSSEEGIKLWIEFQTLRNEYRTLSNRMDGYISDRRVDTVVTYLMGNFREMQNLYIDKLGELMELNENALENAGEEIKALISRSLMLLIVSTIISIIMIVGFTVWSTMSTGHGVKNNIGNNPYQIHQTLNKVCNMCGNHQNPGSLYCRDCGNKLI